MATIDFPVSKNPLGETNLPPEETTLEAPRDADEDVSVRSAGHPYGPPPATERDSNYISDENLLAWLAMKQDGLYGELRDHMDTSKARSKLIEDLNHLKDLIDGGMSPEEATAEMNRLLQAYAGTEFEGALNELFAPALIELGQAPEQASDVVSELDAPVDLPSDLTESAEDTVEGILSQQTLERLSNAIETKVDALGRDDQLALINIQSLTADIRETAQLASNLVSSSNQASNTIVGNIGR